MALQGTLETFALPDVLRLLASTKKSGVLRIDTDRGGGELVVVDGEITGGSAERAPRVDQPSDVLFELLRSTDGSFVFDGEAAVEDTGVRQDVDTALSLAEEQLVEWREIEAVVPSPLRLVELRADRGGREISLSGDQWNAVVHIGAGCTVRTLGERLDLSELPAARLVRDLVQLEAVTLSETDADSDIESVVEDPSPAPELSMVEPSVADTSEGLPPLPLADPTAADSIEQEAPASSEAASTFSSEPPSFAAESSTAFAPADQGHTATPSSSSDPSAFAPEPHDGAPSVAGVSPLFGDGGGADPFPADEFGAGVDAPTAAGSWNPDDARLDDRASSFFDDDDNGDPLADDPFGPDPFRIPRLPSVEEQEESSEAAEMARQLSNLSPRAAQAVAAAAAATNDEERDEALAQVSEDSEEPLNRGLLLKFLSSVDE